MIWFYLYLSLSFIASITLLSTPYLRITSLGWLISIWCIPFLGALFFLLTVIRGRKKQQQLCYCQLASGQCSLLNSEQALFNQLGINNGFLPYFQVTDTHILRDDVFTTQLLTDIQHANSSIWITTYILSGDIKDTLLEHLKEAHNCTSLIPAPYQR